MFAKYDPLKHAQSITGLTREYITNCIKLGGEDWCLTHFGTLLQSLNRES